MIARAELIRSNLETQAELCQRLADITSHADGLAAEWNQVAREMSSLVQTLFPARLGSNAIDTGAGSAETSDTASPSDGSASAGADNAKEVTTPPPSPKGSFARRAGSFVDLIAQSAKRRAA